MENNPLIKHYKASVREFDRIAENIWGDTGMETAPYEFKTFLLRDRISFWESEILRMEGMKLKGMNDFATHNPNNVLAYETAIYAMLKPYREAVKWGKEHLTK